MPELPDIELYVEALENLLAGEVLENVIIKSPFLLRTFEPTVDAIKQRKLTGFSRQEKKIVWHFENDVHLVFHLMIAGRYHWRAPSRLPTQKNDLAAFQFSKGTMMLTEASKKKRAALFIVESMDGVEQHRRGGLEVLECSLEQFANKLTFENRTLKRCLTSPSNYSGIGNAYSDEILHHAKLSPLKRTKSLTDAEIERLFDSVQSVLRTWIMRLRDQAGEKFPEKVRAFRPEMNAHGKFGEPCYDCGVQIQRIRYAENECNYCPFCQTDGKILADRSLSRLLKDEWPKTIDELE